MKIKTHQFGEIEFNTDRILHFSPGLAGFEEFNKFVLIKTDDELFYWLNSVDEPGICFPLVGLRVIDENFPVEENSEAFGIVTLNKDPLKTTINLKAPVYINQDEKKGFQKVLNDEKYVMDYKLFTE